MISFVLFKWSTPGYRTAFTAAHVNALARMIGHHYDAPHRVVCCTNEPAGIDPGVVIVPDRADFASIPSPHGGKNPSCYRRLRLFAPDAADTFGERIVSIDLDAVITSDLRPLFDRADDFVGWQDACHPRQLCGSLFYLRAGSRPQVRSGFGPGSPALAKAAGYAGSDQAWLSYCLQGEPRWTGEHGVYSYRFDLAEGKRPLPDGARAVFFTGKGKPWEAEQQRVEWVRDAYEPTKIPPGVAERVTAVPC